MTMRQWRDLTSDDFATLDAASTVAVLPLAATEQHGPHLPTGTDAIIAEGLLAETAQLRSGDSDVLILPVLPVGASLEHSRYRGTLSLQAAEMIATIRALGGSVAAAGPRKLVIITAHGGNLAAMTAAALECRARFGLLAVTLSWSRLGLPDGAVAEQERHSGVHGGQVETALMLHFRPDLVRTDSLRFFPSLEDELAGRHALLRAHGPIGFGWLAGDLNPAGVVGDAAAATAELGAAIAAYQARAFAALLDEIAREDVGNWPRSP